MEVKLCHAWQCDIRHAVTFPATEFDHRLTSTKLYCLTTEAHTFT